MKARFSRSQDYLCKQAKKQVKYKKRWRKRVLTKHKEKYHKEWKHLESKSFSRLKKKKDL